MVFLGPILAISKVTLNTANEPAADGPPLGQEVG